MIIICKTESCDRRDDCRPRKYSINYKRDLACVLTFRLDIALLTSFRFAVELNVSPLCELEQSILIYFGEDLLSDFPFLYVRLFFSELIWGEEERYCMKEDYRGF